MTKDNKYTLPIEANDFDKNRIDKTITARGKKFETKIREAGGATFPVRFKTEKSLNQLTELIRLGYGTSRNDVLLKLVEAEFLKQTRKK